MKKKHQSHLITFNQILSALYRSNNNLVSNATLMWFISNVLSWLPNKINNCSNNNDNETHVTCVSLCPVCEFGEVHSLSLRLGYDLTRSHQLCETCHCRVEHQTGCGHNLLIPFNEGEFQHELCYTQLWLWRRFIWSCLLYIKCQKFSFFHTPFIYYFCVSFSIPLNGKEK